MYTLKWVSGLVYRRFVTEPDITRSLQLIRSDVRTVVPHFQSGVHAIPSSRSCSGVLDDHLDRLHNYLQVTAQTKLAVDVPSTPSTDTDDIRLCCINAMPHLLVGIP